MQLNLGNYASVPDFIYGITREIWEDRGIGGKLDQYYADDILLRAATGFTNSNRGVTAQTLQTLHQFPDRRLVGEDVIWTPYPDGSFLSSHRLTSVMRHTGDGIFGKATGRVVRSRIIADCWVRDQVVVEEWLVRDQGAIARQIGIEPRELAQTWLNQRGGWNKPVAGPAPDGYLSHVSDESAARSYAQTIEAFAHGGQDATVYDEAVHHIGPGEATRYGRLEVNSFWSALFASLQVESFAVEHLALNLGGGRSDRVALRWRARARHTNHASTQGLYGPASGRSVEIMGINHAEVVNGQVLREWVLVDEVALWMQVLTAQA